MHACIRRRTASYGECCELTKDIAPRHSLIGHTASSAIVVPIQAVQVVARVTAFIDQMAVTHGQSRSSAV